MNTPLVFIIFNRPDTTQKVFNAIKLAKPKILYVIADGPRINHQDDAQKCAETRNIINQINWPCEVTKDYSEINLGCKQRIVSGINNAFKKYDKAIILEDDCLPNQSFFMFCEEMLEKYKKNEKIFSITGNNFLFDKQKLIKESYYFSSYPYIWGWATWKRVWHHYDPDITTWPTLKTNGKYDKSFTKAFNGVYKHKINTWDIQFVYLCLFNQGLTIVPSQNLVSNIGFGNNSTHTTFKTIVANMKTTSIIYPLIHPTKIIANPAIDKVSRSHFTRFGIIIDMIKHSLKID